MSRDALTEAIARMATDADFAERVRHDPDVALSDYPLTAEERRSLASMSADDAGGSSPLGQRLSKSSLFFGAAAGGGGGAAAPAVDDTGSGRPDAGHGVVLADTSGSPGGTDGHGHGDGAVGDGSHPTGAPMDAAGHATSVTMDLYGHRPPEEIPPPAGPTGHSVAATYDADRHVWVDAATGSTYDPTRGLWWDPNRSVHYDPWHGLITDTPVDFDKFVHYVPVPPDSGPLGSSVHAVWSPHDGVWIDPFTNAQWDAGHGTWHAPYSSDPYPSGGGGTPDPKPAAQDADGTVHRPAWDPVHGRWIDYDRGTTYNPQTGSWDQAFERPPLGPDGKDVSPTWANGHWTDPSTGAQYDSRWHIWTNLPGGHTYDPWTGDRDVSSTSASYYNKDVPATDPFGRPFHPVYDQATGDWTDPVTGAHYSPSHQWVSPLDYHRFTPGETPPGDPPVDPQGRHPVWEPGRGGWVLPQSGQTWDPDTGSWSVPTLDAPPAGPHGESIDARWDQARGVFVDPSSGATYDPKTGVWADPGGQRWYDPWSGKSADHAINADPADVQARMQAPNAGPFGGSVYPNWDPATHQWIDPTTGAHWNGSDWVVPGSGHVYSSDDAQPTSDPPTPRSVWDPSTQSWVEPVSQVPPPDGPAGPQPVVDDPHPTVTLGPTDTYHYIGDDGQIHVHIGVDVNDPSTWPHGWWPPGVDVGDSSTWPQGWAPPDSAQSSLDPNGIEGRTGAWLDAQGNLHTFADNLDPTNPHTWPWVHADDPTTWPRGWMPEQPTGPHDQTVPDIPTDVVVPTFGDPMPGPFGDSITPMWDDATGQWVDPYTGAHFDGSNWTTPSGYVLTPADAPPTLKPFTGDAVWDPQQQAWVDPRTGDPLPPAPEDAVILGMDQPSGLTVTPPSGQDWTSLLPAPDTAPGGDGGTWQSLLGPDGSSTETPPVDQTPLDQTPLDQTPLVDQPQSDQPPLDQTPPVDQTQSDQPPADQQTTDESPSDQQPVTQSAS